MADSFYLATNNSGSLCLKRLEVEETPKKSSFHFFESPLVDAFLILIGMLLYALTIAPGLSWANGGADGGDLVAAAVLNGIPHPPGYPLYITLARFFLALPWGTPSFRVNILSAVCGIVSALLMRRWLMRTLSRGRWQPVFAFSGAVALLSAPMPWSQSVIAEVYSLNLLLVLCFLLSLQGHNPFLQGLCLGLAISHHVINLALVPLLFFSQNKTRNLLLLSVGIAAGLLPYILIPWRAWQNPAINWGNPKTWQGFFWVLRGELYTSYLTSSSFTAVLARVPLLFKLWLENLSPVGIFLALYGFLLPMPRHLRLQSVSLWLAYSAVALIYQSYDSYLYIIPTLAVWLLWAALGLNSLLKKAQGPLAVWSVALLFMALTAEIIIRLPIISAAEDNRAEIFGMQFRQNAPAQAIIFAEEDPTVFALWYFHFALKQRSDTHIFALRLLQYDWYTQAIAETYSDLSLPKHPAPWYAHEIAQNNFQNPACFLWELPARQGLFSCSTNPFLNSGH